MSSISPKKIFLDVDSSIVENNLRFVNKQEQDDFNKIFGPPPDSCPSKLVKPFPGYVVKTKLIGSDIKLFVNICHTDSIPAPKDINEDELKEILNSDEITEFRIPMSIGDLRSDFDKKGEEAKVCDIAINPQFYKKIETISLFKHFFMTVVFEGLKNKHEIDCCDEKLILKNRKVFGNLQTHRIQQREIDEKMLQIDNTNKSATSLIEELTGNEVKAKPVIETISSVENKPKIPEYRLFRRKEAPNCLVGEFLFPDVLSAKELTLDIGEDRILVESNIRNYLLDIFVPCIIRQKSCTSNFERSTKVLTVTMPLMGG